MSQSPEKLSIIIPMFNEARTIGALLSSVADVAFDIPVEMIVVDDGSTDQSAEIVRQVAAEHGNLRLLCKSNGGKGSAVRAAIAVATGTIMVIQDADLEYDPADIPAVVAPIVDGRAAVVYGSRILRKRVSDYTALRYYVGGRLLSFVTNALYGSRLTDEPTCYKAMRMSLVRELELTCDGFDFCPEVTGKILRRGVPILEVPISYRARSVHEGKKIRVHDAVIAIRVLIRERLRPLPRTIGSPAAVSGTYRGHR